MIKINKEEILEKISSMTLVEIVELIDAMEKKFGISSKDYQKNILNNEKSKKVEKNEFDLFLNDIGKNKIAVIKIIRSFLNLGLKESKDLVESAPVLIKEKIIKKDLDIIKKSLEDVGAVVLVK